MNSDLVRWLLDLDVIPQGAAGLRLAWERPWPSWVWAIVFIGAGLAAAWTYSGLVGVRWGRGVLAGLRYVTILLVLIIICGPVLELPREHVEPDWVLMLADRSESMRVGDAPSQDGGTAPRASRDEQLRASLAQHADLLGRLERERHVVWLGFDAGAYPLAGSDPSRAPAPGANSAEAAANNAYSGPPLGEADGRQTRIGTALEQALAQAAARPVSGVVLFSDGRTDDPASRALIRRLSADAVPVYVVPLGSRDPLGDLAVRRVEAPRRAFVGDRVPVVVEVDRLGSSVREQGAIVRLVDTTTGDELDRIELPAGDSREEISLTAEPGVAGEATWQVVLDTAEPDLIAENNLQQFSIELVDRPLRILLIEGYPRWEYRYLKNLLIREKTIESSVMLLSADRDFAQEGNMPITRLPKSPEEFAEYDVIILGDVPGTFLSAEQLDMIRDHVAQRGAGLLWIGGERSTPRTFAGTSLADLLPMRGELKLAPIGAPVNIRPTDAARRLGVLQLVRGGGGASSSSSGDGLDAGWPLELEDSSYGWSQLYWTQRIEPGQLKPASDVLAETVQDVGGTSLPVVIAMRYGAGQSIYVATDEIWRWRYGQGERYPDQFWVQMIRMLGRESLGGAGEPAVLSVNPRRVAPGQPARIEVRLLDARIAESAGSTITAVLQRGGGGAATGEPAAEVTLQRGADSDAVYSGTWFPDEPGLHMARVDGASLGIGRLSAEVLVESPDDEMRRPEADHESLEALAQATGGAVLSPGDLSGLNRLPKRSVTTVNPLRERLWDTPLAFLLPLLLLTFEWVGRKMLRLA